MSYKRKFEFEKHLSHAFYNGIATCLYNEKDDPDIVCIKVETSGGKPIKIATMPRHEFKRIYNDAMEQYGNVYDWSAFDYQLTKSLTGFELF